MLDQRLDCISHKLVYLSRMLTLRESEFRRLADYVKEFRTCVITSKVNSGDLPIGYLVNSRFVEGLSNTRCVDITLLKFLKNGGQEHHFSSIHFWRR